MLVRLSVLVLASVIVNLSFSSGVDAQAFSWNPAEVEIEISDNLENQLGRRCERKDVVVVNHEEGALPGSSYHANGCVFRGKDFQIASFQKYGLGQMFVGIKLSSDSEYRVISNVVPELKINVSSGSNRFGYYSYSSSNHILTSVEDASSGLESARDNSLGQTIMYRFKDESVKKWLSWFPEGNPNRHYREVGSVAYSINGRYGLAWVNYEGHVKIDFELGTTQVISQKTGSWMVSLYNPTAAAITNDGRYAFVGNTTTVVDTYECGYELAAYLYERFDALKQTMVKCNEQEYALAPLLGYTGRGLDFEWIGDEQGLQFTYNYYPYTSDHGRPQSLITLWREKPNNSKLDYLALGDSYTSGEGDTGKNANGESHYTLGTNSERGCHLSSRAYPFLLAGLNNISSGRMQSVACSGAQMSKDYYGPSNLYFGQSNMLLGKSESELTIERTAALDNFSPGIVKQTDFVAANKPKVITLTGGGNDVGFGKIMSYCANIIHEKKFTGTCDYAQKGSKLHGLLANAIKGEYDHLKDLIDSIKTASPDTTIYVVGYPSFVASKLGCINDAALNRTEVDMLNASIAYMNEVLKKAAALKGAHFIDTEYSLQGGRICEGGTYVTGPAELIFGAKLQEAFHPNALGHEQLAGTIMASGFSVTPKSNPAADGSIVAPTAPDYFSAAGKYKAEQRNVVPNTMLGKGQKILLSIPKLVLRPLSELTITLYSKPVNLGTGKVSSDGSFARDIVIPTDVSPGYHVLIVEGIDQEGNPITFYQFIEIANTGSDDLDGDGVKNDRDGCMYIQKWYDETTGKDICKVASIAKSLAGHGNGSGLGHDIGLGKGHQKDIEFALPVSR